MTSKLVLAVIVGLGVTLVIYLTPLKNLNLIEPSIRDIDPKEFQEKFSKDPDHYVFIDVRPAYLFNKIHAKGSINIELHRLYSERNNLPKRGKEIVIICTGGFASGVAYSYLEHYGFLNLHRVRGGIEKWQADALPVEVEKII